MEMQKNEFKKIEALKVLSDFGVNNVDEISPFGDGHINVTYKVSTPETDYILQKVDTNIFKDFDGMMQNISRVCNHLSDKSHPTMKVIAYKKPWRLYSFVQNSYSVYVLDKTELAYKGAKAFAQFQNALADIGNPRLVETIPHFLDLRDRIRQYDDALNGDVCNRAKECQDLIYFINERRHYKDTILGLMDEGKIPERITHNDTKINNVLFDKDTDEVLAVVDLDTVMPGCALYDFGDMVRSATASTEEDETNLDKVYSKEEFFEALVRGYLSEAKFLNQYEIEKMAFSGLSLTFCQTVRFLTDYLNGDTYFATKYDTHNLDRARNQAKMCLSIEEQMTTYENIVNKVAEEEGF